MAGSPVFTYPVKVERIKWTARKSERKRKKEAKLWYLDKITFSDCLPGFWVRST